MDFTQLGKRIRDERLLLRLTLANLAERIDKSINFIGQIERGEGRPSVETLVDIANALGTTVDYLLQDNLAAVEEEEDREINALLQMLDENGRKFVLEAVKSYAYFHKK